MHQDFVNQIHKEKAKNDSNSRDLAQTLNVLSKTVFGEVNRFVFELLQNADDSSSNGNPIDVGFRLLDNYLVFSHNGKHFTKQDVQGISGIGNRASQKDKNNEKTGYKGIGFKSVFGSSDYVHILSGGFSFRFDKNYEGFEGSEDYPWQVVPIWTNEPDDEVLGNYEDENVNTIIKIKNKKVIRDEIIKVFSDCQIILFLRNVKNVCFFDDEKKVFEVTKSLKEGVVNLYNNKNLESSWILKTMDLPIDNTLSYQLNQLSETVCPQKLKEAKATKLTFAAKVEDKHLIAVKRTVIYSYLPTQAEKGFPFLINGDFLMNAERTELMPNIWNEFLFKEIACKQLEWFRDLQETQYKYDVLKLLNGKYPEYSASNIDKEYNKSLEKAIATVDFLPEQDNDEYTITLTSSLVDVPQFSKMFSTSIITDYLKISDTHGVVDLNLENQSSIIALGAKQFTFANLLELIASGVIDDSNSATNIIVFFYNRTINSKNAPWLAQLMNAAFIMDDSGNYKTPKEIFIPSQTNTLTIDFENLSYIHSDILEHFNGKTHVMNWLQSLGVREPTDLEVVRKSLIPLILNGGITDKNWLSITRFLFKVYQTKLFSDKEYEDLKSLPLFTTNGLKTPARCYLSDRYNPERKLSAVLPKANFLLDDYIENDEEIAEWKVFLKKIGVRENISIDLIEDKIERQSFERLHAEAKLYFDWLETTNSYPAIYHSYRYSGQHYIQNFTSIEFSSHLSEIEFSKFFWGKMLEGWDNFKNKCSSTRYYYRGGSDIVPSYIQFYIKKFKCIPCTDGKCYTSDSIFSPSLKSTIGSLLPVADLPTSITAEQMDFFGFKRTISIAECLNLLNKLGKQKASAELNKQIFSIYDHLISHSSSNDPQTKEIISIWGKTGVLLTINNTFQPVKDLYTFSVQGTATPVNSERFIKLPISWSFDEIKALSDLLNIPVITFNQLKFVAEGANDEKALQSALIKRASFLALIHSHNSGENFIQIISKLNTILRTTRFLQAEKLNLIYESENGDLIVNSKIDAWSGKLSEFYFTGKWSSPLTLYSLSNSICALLDLKNMEREFALMLQLSDSDIYKWLGEKGYKVDQLVEEEIITDTSGLLVEEFPEQDGSFDGIDIDIFVEKVKIADIDFTKVVPVVRDFTAISVPSEKEYLPIKSEQVKVDIGRWSEEYVFQYFQQNQELFPTVKWLNETEESYLPYDFEVIENGIKKFIEVKGTPSLTKEVIFLSGPEWKILFDTGVNYSIFRVFGAGTTSSRLERTDDLKALVSSGKMLSFPIQLIIP